MAGRHEEPLHRELAGKLREQIRRGEFKGGDKIPTELQLCADHSVSRTTVREAVQQLVNEGLLDRQQGRGTFVRESPAAMGALFQPLRTQEFHFRPVNHEWIAPPFDLAAAFSLPVTGELFKMTRLRLAMGTPAGVTRYFAATPALRDHPPSAEELAEITFDTILIRRGVTLIRSNVLVEPAVLSEVDAKLLGAAVGALSLRIERVGFDETGKAVRLSRSINRPDHPQLLWSIRHPQPAKGRPGDHNFSVWTAAALE